MKNKLFLSIFTLALGLILVVQPATAQGGYSVSVDASPNPALPGDLVTISVSVSDANGAVAGAGVDIAIDGVNVDSCTTGPTGDCSISRVFGDGTYDISASYSGSSGSTTLVVSPPTQPPTNTPVPPTRTNTPIPPTRTNTPIPPTRTNTPSSGPGEKTPTPTRFVDLVPPRRTLTPTYTPLVIPTATATDAGFFLFPRRPTATTVPTRTPRATEESVFAFPTIGAEVESTPQPSGTPINFTAVLTVILTLALGVMIIVVVFNFRRVKRMLKRLIFW